MVMQLLAVLVCLSPLLMLGAGYYIGRYGSPIVIKRQRRSDRRMAAQLERIPPDEEVEIYH